MRQIDCVIVGSAAGDLESELRRAELARSASGAYDQLRLSLTRYRGRTVDYTELLNEAVAGDSDPESALHVGRLPSLGASCLKDFLADAGFHAEIVNLLPHDEGRLEELLDLDPIAIAITTTLTMHPDPVRRVVDFVRERSDRTRIVVGGPHVLKTCLAHAGDPRRLAIALRRMGADYYVNESQGEGALAQLVRELKEPSPDPRGIANLLWVEGDALVETERVIEANDINRHGVDWSRFDREFLTPTVITRTARSCAFKCSFCTYPVLAGALDLQELPVIEAQFDRFRDAGVKVIGFIDDTFNVPLPRFKEMCRMMIRSRYGFRWYSYFRGANADDETYDLMAEAGCAGTFLGIESGSQAILDNMNKSSKVERYLRSIQALNERGIWTHASILYGFPGETEETLRETHAFLDEANPTSWFPALWWCDANAPVAKRTEEFDIAGSAYSWSHRTMDWREASAAMVAAPDRVRSRLLPRQEFGFWALPYLDGLGHSHESIHSFLRIAQDLQSRESTADDERDLAALFDGGWAGSPR